MEAYRKDPALPNLLLDDYFRTKVLDAEKGWRRVAALAIENALPVPALVSGLTYLDGYRSEKLPANMIQAQRDFFGAHMYERTDKPRGQFFHTNWTGSGGDTTSTTYND
jgi:6-phosphogluconate dehydrogenase